ncbi:hypothetical protein GH714_015056 [Hevea brasiliensis]|uniref:Retrotransposon gag domain-containing protein n=1 Tax=Hevea brasiliensis TaxID=3981 RepID=A0A6A6NH98_HEVBR|nr:hypothetical protein GH714_015056 [Hevea brasiliensis]
MRLSCLLHAKMRFRGARGVLGACWAKPGDGRPKTRFTGQVWRTTGPPGVRAAWEQRGQTRRETRFIAREGRAGMLGARADEVQISAGRLGARGADEVQTGRGSCEARGQTRFARRFQKRLESAGGREERWARAGCQPAQTRFTRAGSPPKRELRLLLKVTMADQSEITLGVGVAPTVVEHEGGRRKGRGKSRDPSRAREDLGDLEKRLAKVELHLVDGEERFEEMDTRLMELDERMEELRGDMQGALNAAFDKLASEGESLRLSQMGEIAALRDENRAIGITEDAKKVDHAPLYLVDTAMVWWRRRHGDMEKGLCTIASWEEFKRELKRQFYPENAAHEARARLRRLSHRGSIREYVKEFMETLEIPDYPDAEALFAFTDGLQTWARMEIERRGARDLATAISIAESLVEFQRSERSRISPQKDRSEGGDSRGKDGSSNPPAEGGAS